MIRSLLDIYILVLIVDAILSYMPQIRHHSIVQGIRKLSDLTLNPTRKFLNRLVPSDLPFDISPIVVIFAIKIIMTLW